MKLNFQDPNNWGENIPMGKESFVFFFFLKQMDILAVSNKIQKASSANF